MNRHYYEPRTFEEYLDSRREMLGDMAIWNKLSPYEQIDFETCKTEMQVDNKMRAYIRKYL